MLSQVTKIDSLQSVIKVSPNDSNKVKNLINLGIEFFKAGDFEGALTHEKEANLLANKIVYKKGIGNALNVIGAVYLNTGDNDKAREVLLVSLKIRAELGDKKGMATSLCNIGNAYRAQGDFPQALSYYLKAIEARESINDKKGTVD